MSMKIYKVGGCVRDRLLREEGFDAVTGDRDWVVVGATPADMTSRGFMPVGADFPVFLHPETHEEYALARTERKTARGYHGFDFYTDTSVTLEEDLARRDLTINAIAEDENGVITDPYGGARDLKAHVLRHVSPAFKEDPVRILRIARFAARFPIFTVAPETMDLLRSMVNCGEADALVAERVWKEVSRALEEIRPSRMLDILNECGYWPRAFAAVPVTEKTKEDLDRAAQRKAPLAVRCALLFASVDTEAKMKAVMQQIRAPSVVSELCTLAVRMTDKALAAKSTEEICEVMEKSDVLRRPERFADFLQFLELASPQFSAQVLRRAALAFASVDAGAIAKMQTSPSQIPVAIAAARREAVRALLA